MPRRSGAGYREVGAWIVAGTVLLACWIGMACAGRRAARREAAARARARQRRQRVPLVSANVRGQSTRKPDMWRDESESAARDERVA
jgi:C4-dicarboxylate-specific signal transduction histidine kinase